MNDRKKSGISFLIISLVFVFILIGSFVGLMFISSRINKKIASVELSINNFVICEKSSQTIKDTANYLTEQAQLFIMTHNERYADNYIKEIYETKSREKAINELLDKTGMDNPNYQRLKIAMEQSESLSNIELYGIRLAFEAMNLNEMPAEIRSIEIRSNDLRETMEEKQQVAQETIYGEGYLIYKNRVNQNCLAIISEIAQEIQIGLQREYGKLNNLLNISYILQAIFVFLGVLFFIMLVFLVIRPLKSFIVSIRKKESLSTIGSTEFKYLAETYNEVYEFDVLTKILNNRAFADLCHKYKNQRCTIALVLVEVDNFTELTEKLGNSKADFVLQTIASYLNLAFRKVDNVARIGTAEFAILIPNFSRNNFMILANAMYQVNSDLKQIPDLADVETSTGIAFSDEGYTRALYESADKALYDAKAREKGKICVAELDVQPFN